MTEDHLPVTEEVYVKECIWDNRNELNNLLRESTRLLSEKTGMIGVAVTSDGHVYSSGYANILSLPEFYDIDVTRAVLSIIESHQDLTTLFARITELDSDPIHIIVGDDFGIDHLYPCGMAYVDFSAGNTTGTLGVIGPARLNYPFIYPMLRHMGGLIDEISATWS